MHRIDWLVLGLYAAVAVAGSVWFAHRGRGSSTGDEYIVAGRRLPWWVVGIADVATGDGADAFWLYVFFAGGFMGYFRFFWISAVVSLPLGVLWARYWRRLLLASPGQLYEERYGGGAAAALRSFSAVYGTLVTIGILLGYVLRGFSQSLVPFLGWSPDAVLLVFCGGSLAFTLVSGLLAVAYTDVVQFALMMLGRVLLAAILLHAAGGLGAAVARVQEVRGADFLQPYPPASAPVHGEFLVDPLSLGALLLMGIFGVAGTQTATVQKALAARSEWHAAVGQIFGALLSLVVRVLPMALVGLAAVALLPAGRRDTDLWADLVRRHVPPGLVGLLLTGIVAGYVSTIDGLVNFSAAGLLNDVYRRHLRPGASERQQVAFGRLATAGVIGVAYLWARVLIGHIDGAWINFINSVVGLFTLPLALLRWTWWRLNIYAEITGFVASFPLAYVVWFGLPRFWPAFKDRPYWQAFALLFGCGWAVILLVTLLSRPERPEVLQRFYLKVRPPGLWGPVRRALQLPAEEVRDRRLELRHDLLTAVCGVCFTGSLVVALGAALSGRTGLFGAVALTAAAAAVGFVHLSVRGERLRARLHRP